MLNGHRHLWICKTQLSKETGKEITIGTTYHRVCPSYKHFSAITNNGFVGISWFMFLPISMLVAAGVVTTVFVTWIIGLVFFLAAPLPWLWVARRYHDSTPWKWEDGTRIHRAEKAYLLMPKHKQIEYREFIDAVFRGNLDAEEAKKLFQKCSRVDTIHARLKEEAAKQEEYQQILEEINESTRLRD